MEKIRKIFVGGIIFVTVLSMCAVVVPTVSAAASAGDLIKMSGLSSVYYLAANGKRYVFPNEQTYFSWYSDFSGVVTIPQSELESYPLGANVTIRPGTKLVKITTDPKVYAVEPNGTLKHVPDETTASTLFGANWAKRVVDVSDAFFTNYTVSSTKVSATAYPIGSLVKWSGAADVYYIASDGKAQKIANEAAFTANRFKWSDVISAPASVAMPTAGTDITGAVATLTDTSSGAGGSAGAGTGLTVAIASDTPASATVVADTADGAQAMIPALKLNFTAAADGDVKVKTVKITRGGISADTDVVNMYLYDGDTRLATNPSISTKVYTFTSSSGLFTVTKGTTKAITVKFDLKNAASAGITMTFSLAAAADITTDGATVSGSYPITSNTFTSASVTDLGKFTLTNVAPTAASNVDPGQTAYEIWRFTAASVDQDIELRKMMVTIVGSINIGDLKNFSLWDGATQIGSTVVDMSSSKTVTFDMTAAPYKVAKGVTRTWSLKADIIGGSTRTFRATLQNAGDILIYDKGYGVFLKHAGTDTFTIIEPTTGSAAVNYTISSGTLTMSIAADSPIGNIASSTTGVTLLKVNVKANGEDVKIASMVINCSDTTNTGATVKNLKILFDGSQVGSAIATSAACDAAADNSYTFGSSMIARVGQTHVLTIVADITGTTSANDYLLANIETGTGTGQGLVSLSSVNVTAVAGRTLQVKAGTITAVKNAAFGDKTIANPTGVVNGGNTKIASFTIIGGSGEDAEVTQIALYDVSTTYYLSKYCTNVKLMHDTTQLGTTMSSPSSGASAVQTHTFNISPAITVTKNSQYVVDVYCDVTATSLTTAQAVIQLYTITANGKTTGTTASLGSSSAFNLQTMVFAAAGGVTVAIDTDTKLATNLLMGAVDQELAKFKFTASSSESITLSTIVVSGAVTLDATGSLQNLRLYGDDGVQIGSAVAGFDTTNATTTYAHAVFSGLSVNIAKGASKVITVKADVTPYETAGYSTTGQAVKLAIMNDYYYSTSMPIGGAGTSSGVALTTSTITYTSNTGSAPLTTVANATTTQLAGNTLDVRSNEFVLYRAKVSIAWASDTPSGVASPSAAQTIAKFVVTNTANVGGYAATVKYLNFALSSTISNTVATDRVLTVYKDSLSTTALGSTTYNDVSMAVATDSYTNTGFVNGDITDVEISSGASKTFYVTLDTTPAASTKSLSITIPNFNAAYQGANQTPGVYGLSWSDGVTTTIVANDNLLPLTYKTFTY